MPVKGSKKVSSELNVRQSPRKRKHEPEELEEHTPKENGTFKKSKQANSGLPVQAKEDIVVDEPARSLISQEIEAAATTAVTPGSVKKAKAKAVKQGHSEPDSQSEPELKQKRKPKAKKESEAMPLAARTPGLKMFVGAHVSIAKGVENAITNAVNIGGNALALFLQSQRKWENPDLKNENKEAFMHACSHHSYDAKSHIVPHGSYLVNLAAKDKDMAEKSYKFFLNDLKRCEALGIRYYNFHPGATNKEPLSDAIGRIADNLNKALSATQTVTPLLENMAGTESIVGSRFSDLREIIAQIKPEFKSRIGICIDTCHTFAAGYDLRTPEAFKQTFQELDEVVGLKYLKAMHMNDSKGTFKSKKDLHQNIGVGFLGLRAFHNIMNDPRLQNVPLILETPCERPDPKDPKKTIDDKTVWAREIKLLESLIGMDPAGDEFQRLEKELSDQGKAERDKMEQWMREKEDKDRIKEEKSRKKLQKTENNQSKLSFATKSKAKKASVDSELSELSASE